MASERFESKVAGVTFEGRQEIIRKHCRSGKHLDVRPEPLNPHSKNALGLWVRGKKPFGRYWHQVGYVPKELANRLRKRLDKGCSFTARIDEVVGGFDGLSYGLRIEIFVHDQTRTAPETESPKPPPLPDAPEPDLEAVPIPRPHSDRELVQGFGCLGAIMGLLLLGLGSLITRFSGSPSKIFHAGVVALMVGIGIWLIGIFSAGREAPAEPEHLADGSEK